MEERQRRENRGSAKALGKVAGERLGGGVGGVRRRKSVREGERKKAS